MSSAFLDRTVSWIRLRWGCCIDQRYYASAYGRFNTADPGYAGALDDPGSLNKYSYVLGDPVNGYDPEGLCSVIGSGITQSAHSDSTSGQEQFANATAGITVTPYSNGTVVGGALKVMAQGVGIPTGATLNWLDAIALAAQTPGPISIYAFSGSGGAFTNAYNWLSPEIQSRITNITYIDPGNYAQPLASGKPGTNVTLFTDNSDAANIAVQLFGVPPDGPINVINTGTCGHDENWVFNRFSEQLSQTATNCAVGGGSVFGLPQRKPTSGFRLSRMWNWIFDPAPVPSVNSTITYQPVQSEYGN